MAVEERKQYMIPVNVVAKTEIFKGIGVKEAFRILICGLVGLIPFLLLAVPKVEDTEMVYVEVQASDLEYNEYGEDTDIEANIDAINENIYGSRYEEKEVTIMVNKYSTGTRSLFIIIPMFFMGLLSIPLNGSVSAYDTIGHAIKFQRGQKKYFYRRVREDGE